MGRRQLQVLEAQLLIGCLVVAVNVLEFEFRARQHVHAQFLMLGQRVAVRLLEVRQLVLQHFQLGAQLVRFLGQELGGFTGALGALLDVFVQEQRDQFIGHLVGDVRLTVFKAQTKRNRHLSPAFDIGTHQRNGDRVAHFLDLFAQGQLSALGREQVVFIDDPFQMLSGHHALADHLDALIGEGIVVGPHQVRRNLLRLNQNGAGRFIGRR
ncbi:hypothetical protein D3C73_750960 [compost metagenome]